MSSTRCVIYGLLLVILSACGGASDQAPARPPVAEEPAPPLPLPDNSMSSQYQVLLVGNSHVYSNDLAWIIKQMILAGPKKAEAYVRPAVRSTFLDERVNDQMTLPVLKERTWTHVILQGQKYSTTGENYYPIDAALYWINKVKELKATPILFPEHPRLGNREEGQRVFELHQDIAAIDPACVAPVGPAWDAMAISWREVKLHYTDGNHAALAGSFLTALLFYQIITGETADTLDHIDAIDIPEQQQQWMRQTASAALQRYPACVYGQN